MIFLYKLLEIVLIKYCIFTFNTLIFEFSVCQKLNTNYLACHHIYIEENSILSWCFASSNFLFFIDVGGSEKTVGVPVSQFFVQDLLDGFIHYSQSDHKNKEPVTDNFLFHVTDGVNKSPMQRFGVSIVVGFDVLRISYLVEEGM